MKLNGRKLGGLVVDDQRFASNHIVWFKSGRSTGFKVDAEKLIQNRQVKTNLRFFIFNRAFFRRLLSSIETRSISYFFGYMVLLIGDIEPSFL